MSSYYNEKDVTGISYQRAKQIVVDNEYSGKRSIHFAEEIVKVLDEDGTEPTVVSQALGALSEELTEDNQNEEFNLIHPETGAVIGTSTYIEVYVMLHSLYYHMAAKRDNG